MNSADLPGLFALLQPEPQRITTDAIGFTIKAGLFLVVIIVAVYLVFKALRKQRDLSVSQELNEEFEKSKDALLLAAQQKKAQSKSVKDEQRTDDRQQKEMELLKENVDPQLVFGQACPLSGLEMMADQELVIDPYTGQGYHFSSFLNDWPAGQDRPKYVFRYPQGTIVKSEDLLRTF